MKGFMAEFKEFINQGNVMDMAVGIIIGGAFTAIVNSLVSDIIMPLVGMITGGIDFKELAVTVGSAKLTYGNFISAVITFLCVALTVFILVKSVNKFKKAEAEAEPEAPAEDIVLLTEIRDLLKK